MQLRFRCLLALVTIVVLALVRAAGASADGTYSFGVSGVTPTMDTANGDYQDSSTTSNPGSTCPDGIECSPVVNPFSKANPILPGPYAGEDTANAPHAAEDLAVWNPADTVPHDGQVLEVKLTGCAVEDSRSPSQDSQNVPVNTILFQGLRPSGSDWADANVSGQFLLPFCGNSTNHSHVTASTVTTYQPIHMCVSAGDVIALHDIGGFVDDNGAYYPQGIPLKVLAAVRGQSTDSFIGIDSTYGPGISGSGDAGNPQTGFAMEADQEVTMELIEGTGNDAYGLCPGGYGDEPSPTSNSIDCDFRASGDGADTPNPAKYPDHPFCANADEPIPGSNMPPSGPEITRLTFSPSVFAAARGSTVSYADTNLGKTTLRFYLLDGKREKLVKTVRHRDAATNRLHVGGLEPGSYVLKVASTYERKTGRTTAAKFTVVDGS